MAEHKLLPKVPRDRLQSPKSMTISNKNGKRLVDTLKYRLKPRKASSDSESVEGSESDSVASDASSALSLDSQSEESSDRIVDGGEEDLGSDSEVSSQAPEEQAASISFGALAAAQETLGKRKRSNGDDGGDHGPRPPDHTNGNNRHYLDSEALERKAGKKDNRDFSRSSKHAPAEISAKKAVSRKREVVPTKKIDHRDPRFEPLSGALDEQKIKKKYSFLDTYRDSEMAELKTAIRKTKDPDAKEKLKRALLSMESRKKAQKMKEEQQEVLRRHRKEEREMVEQGKKPFYLKKGEQKKRALEERFKSMKGKQIDKVIERRRRKMAARERRSMPKGLSTWLKRRLIAKRTRSSLS